MNERDAGGMLKDLVDKISDGFVALDKDWKYVYVNEIGASFLNNSDPRQLIGKHIWTLFPEGVGQPFQINYEKVMKERVPITMVDYYEPWDKYYENRISPSYDGGITILFTDITEQKKAELRIKESEQEMKMILDNTEEYFLIIDDKFNIVKFNKAANDRAFNVTGENLKTGASLLDLTRPEDKEVAKALYEEVLKGHKKQQKFPVPNVNGGLDYYYSTYSPIFNSEGIIDKFIICSRDVTKEENHLIEILSINEDRKKAEEFAILSLKEKQKIMDSSLDVICSTDKEGKFNQVSIASEKLWGYKPHELIGKYYMDLVYSEDCSSTVDIAKDIMSGKEITFFENRYVRKDGSLIPIMWSARWDEQGQTMYSIARDASEMKKAKEELRRSNERFEYVSKATSDSIWDYNLVTGETFWSKNFEHLFGHKVINNRAENSVWFDNLHVEDKENVMLGFSDAVKSQSTLWQTECRFRKEDGNFSYISIKSFILRNNQGEAVRLIGAIRDVTQEKEHLNEIKQIKQNLDALINNTDDFIWSVDREMRLIAYNEPFASFLHDHLNITVHEGFPILYPGLPEEVKDTWHINYSRALEGEKFEIERVSFIPINNTYRYGIITYNPILNKEGGVVGVACFSKDISELKRAAEKLTELNEELNKRAEELAASNTELERFAYVASHDLQEPLRMVSSFLQLLEKKYEGNLDETAKKYIHFAVDGAARMKRLIKDLLEYSRIGTNSLELVDIDMNSIVEDVIMLFKEEINIFNVHITLDKLPIIKSGKTAMTQLMQNLIGNALKYRSQDKLPTIHISAEDIESHWIFSVKDNGIGIDPRFKEKIFVIFQRLHNKDEFSGTGIGLAICKKIVERYHGQIEVESKPGEGSNFIFSISKLPIF